MQTGGESAAPLSLVEHNEAQIDLMRRMGVDVKNPRAMVGWISQHAANFSTLLEGPENADNARVWRAMLRRPEQRVAALEAMQRALLVH